MGAMEEYPTNRKINLRKLHLIAVTKCKINLENVSRLEIGNVREYNVSKCYMRRYFYVSHCNHFAFSLATLQHSISTIS